MFFLRKVGTCSRDVRLAGLEKQLTFGVFESMLNKMGHRKKRRPSIEVLLAFPTKQPAVSRRGWRPYDSAVSP